MNYKQFLAALATIVFPASAHAQADADNVAAYVPEDQIKKVDIEDRRGIDGMLTVNGNVNMVQNDSVVGQVDGTSLLFGLGIKAGVDWIDGRHEFRNTLTIDESWARTPVLDEFVKNNDVVALEALYNYFIFDWMGAFGRLQLETALLPTRDIRTEAVTYVITDPEANVRSIDAVTELELADSFEPISLYQSGGLFAEPLQTEFISISTRLGIGARETFADGVLVLSDDDDTPEIEVKELDNVFQGGVEGFLGFSGKAYADRLTYELGASVLVPFLNNDTQDRDALELMRYGLTAAVNFSVLSWMGLTYKLKVLNDPQLLDEVQVQNNLLLTFSYSFIERSDPQPPSPTELELEKAKEDADAAKERAKDAEERAAEAEERALEAEAAAKAAQRAAEEAKEDEAETSETPESPTTPESPGGETPE